ncbi:MAG TPA: hypothetical protein VI612_03410 [Candidatus Nanoarchaeia archaeon]|nr:hypothetical protein [Candidatus Nanoarchaeia archaeon]
MPAVAEECATLSFPLQRVGRILDLGEKLSWERSSKLGASVEPKTDDLAGTLEQAVDETIRIPRKPWKISYGEGPIFDSPEFSYTLGRFSGTGNFTLWIDMFDHTGSKLWSHLSCERVEGAKATGLDADALIAFYQETKKFSDRLLDAAFEWYKKFLLGEGIPKAESVYELQIESMGAEGTPVRGLFESFRRTDIKTMTAALKDDDIRNGLSEALRAILRGSKPKKWVQVSSPEYNAIYALIEEDKRTRYTGFAIDDLWQEINPKTSAENSSRYLHYMLTHRF